MLGPTDAEQREYDTAIATAQKDPTQGRARLASFLDRHPDSTLADDAVVPLARLEVKAGKSRAGGAAPAHGAAAPIRRRTAPTRRASNSPRSSRRAASKDEAWKVANRIQPSLLRDDERRDAYRLLADLSRDRGDTAAQLEWLGRLRTTANDEAEVASVDQRDRRGDRAAAGRRAGAAPRSGSAAACRRRSCGCAPARCRCARATRAAASRALAEAERLPLQAERGAAAGAPADRCCSRDVGGPVDRSSPPPPPLSQVEGAETANPAANATGSIGVVVPLTGPLGKVAEDVLRGVLLAANSFGGDPNTPGLRVLVRDSGGTPGTRRRTPCANSVQRGDVGAVVGPLTKEEVEAAGAAAQEVGLPLLTLTRHEGVARDRAEVVRFGLTRRMEAEVLADHAVLALGLGRMAILYPKDEYGREFEALLWQAIEARGGRVVSVAGYAPNATDFATPIRRLLGPQSAPRRGAGEPLDRSERAGDAGSAAAARLRRDLHSRRARQGRADRARSSRRAR